MKLCFFIAITLQIIRSQWISPSLTMPVSNQAMAAGYYQNVIYLVGGFQISNRKSLIEYDIIANTFSHNSSFLPIEMYSFSQNYIQIANNLYLASPIDGWINIFALDTKQFTSYFIKPPTVAADPCLTGADQFLYWIGGWSLQILNINNASWTKGPSTWAYRRRSSCIVTSNNKIYVIGGGFYLDTVEYITIINTQNKNNHWKWTPDKLSEALYDTRAEEWDGQIFVIGGYGDSATTNKVHIIDTVTNSITVANEALADPRQHVSSIIVGNVLYAFGGQPVRNKWQYIVLPSLDPTRAPSLAPITVTNCEDRGMIKHINWNTMVNNGRNEIPDINYSIAASSTEMTLSIDVELDYLGYSYVGNEYGFGTTYHLGFYPFDKDSVISNCDNRLASSFVNKTWSQQWEYSEYPYLNDSIGSDSYLAYPPPSEYWTLSMDESDYCSKIKYSAVFSWDDLIQCKSGDGASDAVSVIIDDEYIQMSGTFFVNIISPFSMNANVNHYRIYELLSSPFTITIQKSSYNADSIDILTFTSTIVAVQKNLDSQTTLEIIVLTESTNYVSLSNPVIRASPDYDKQKISITNDDPCLSYESSLCLQVWDMVYVDVECNYSLNADFLLQFTANCNGINEQCTDYINTNGSGISLSAGLVFEDEICDEKLWSIEYGAQMIFYENGSFATPITNVVVDGDRVFVEIIVDDFDVDSNGYAVLDTNLLNVWLCTSENELYWDPNNLTSSGCFTSNIDPDGPYHIIVNYNESIANGTRHEPDNSNNVVRFSFTIPNTITRDTLFIQTQIQFVFSQDPSRRRLLATSGSKDATQMVYRSGSVLLTRDNEVVPNDNPIEDKDGNESTNDTNHYIYIIIGISVVFVVILVLMVIFMVYKTRGKPNYEDVSQIEPEIDNNQLTAEGEEQAIITANDT